MTQTYPSQVLATLPEEILQAIFQYLDPKTLLSAGATARRFLELSNEPLLWKRFCQNEIRYVDDRKGFRRLLRDAHFHNWQQTYKDQYTISCSTRTILDDIILSSQGRSDKIEDIVKLGYPSKQTLLKAFTESADSPNHLAQRYWSHVALGCLHRTKALSTWMNSRRGTSNDDDLTELCLAAFDLFILEQSDVGDVDDIFDRLDSYVDAVRSAYPDLEEQTPRARAITIAAYLRERRWVGIDQDREYQSLDNMFLGVALFSSHNNSLPLITSVIYSYVCRRFGLRAQPINYPMHVHVLVRPTPGIDLDGRTLVQNTSTTDDGPSSATHLYMDPFNNTEPVSISTLRTHLRFIAPAATSEQFHAYISPATHRDMLIRSAHNILATRAVDTGPLTHAINPESAMYAAFFALVLFPTHPATLRTHLTELTQHFLHHYDHDIAIFRNFILPMTSNLPNQLAYHNLAHQLLRNDMEPVVPKFRTPSDPDSEHPVRFRIGQLFRHRRRNYRALIYGWDATCEMTQQWISMNQVDRLPRGRHQPFYNVLVLDDRSTRYVAEENVVLLGPESEGGNGEFVTMDEVLTWPIEVGKWMKRFEVDEEGKGYRFVSNVRDQYPED